jgi:hypothetical protein
MGGDVLEIKESITYEESDFVFTKFVNNFKSLRSMGGYYDVMGKLIINSLYGSFGLNNKETQMVVTFSEEEFYNIKKEYNVINFYKVNNVFILNLETSFLKNKRITSNFFDDKSKRNVSYAAAITSKARIKLYKAFKEVEDDGGRILYCDTDSIFAAYSKDDYRTNTKTFKWLDFYENSCFASSKTYALKSKEKCQIKIKGFNNLDISFSDFENNFLSGNTLAIENQLVFYKSNFSINKNISNKILDFGVYDKRVFSKNKKKTEPVKFN